MEVDSPEVEEPPSKKQSRRGRPSKAKSPPEPEAEPDVDEEPELASIDDFMKITRWVRLISFMDSNFPSKPRSRTMLSSRLRRLKSPMTT